MGAAESGACAMLLTQQGRVGCSQPFHPHNAVRCAPTCACSQLRSALPIIYHTLPVMYFEYIRGHTTNSAGSPGHHQHHGSLERYLPHHWSTKSSSWLFTSLPYPLPRTPPQVTIDIKAPRDGTLLGILVKVDETVIPGQLIATVDDAAAAAAFGAPATPQQQPEAAAPAAAAAAPAGAAAAAAPAEAAAAPERQPGIKFPPRVTPDGQRISALSAAEAASWLQRLTGGAAPHAAAPAAAAPAAAAVAAAVHPPQLPVSPAAAAVGKTARAKVGLGGLRGACGPHHAQALAKL